MVAVAAQRNLVARGVVIVVSIVSRHLTQRGVALHRNETLEHVHARALRHHTLRVGGHVDVEYRAVDLVALETPHQHHADHYRVARLVVHLYRLGVQVAGAKRYLLRRHEEIDPPESRVVERSAIFAEESQHARLVGLHENEAFGAHQAERQQQHRAQDYDGRVAVDADLDRVYRSRDSCQYQRQGHEAVGFPSRVLVISVFHDVVVLSRYIIAKTKRTTF